MMERPPGEGFYLHEGASHGRDSWCGGPIHIILLILFLVLLIGGGVWLVRRLSLASSIQAAVPAAVATTGDPAVSALRMRYANGEISREDFRHAMDDLTGTADPWPSGNTDAGPPPDAG